MELKIQTRNIIDNKNNENIENVDDLERKLISICHITSATNTFSKYYPYDGTYMYEDMFL